ncbi:MAG: hypothetical protein JW888_12870 [Pirellulales bacterium]|nr:hypothetical protein [Pirellulales bacterium]
MSIMAKSSKKPDLKKPHPDFPLFPHKGTNRWAKKIRGKIHYFGKVLPDDPKGEKAVEVWLDHKDDLLAGRTPRAKGDGLTVADLANHFLTFKQELRDSGELAPRSYDEYYATCEIVVNAFGKNPLVDDLAADDFRALRVRFAKRFGPVRLGNSIQRVRSLFKYGYEADSERSSRRESGVHRSAWSELHRQPQGLSGTPGVRASRRKGWRRRAFVLRSSTHVSDNCRRREGLGRGPSDYGARSKQRRLVALSEKVGLSVVHLYVTSEAGKATGSGFIVAGDMIVTNYHVVEVRSNFSRPK